MYYACKHRVKLIDHFRGECLVGSGLWVSPSLTTGLDSYYYYHHCYYYRCHL